MVFCRNFQSGRAADENLILWVLNDDSMLIFELGIVKEPPQ